MRMRKLRNITKPGSSLYICVGEGVLRDFTLDFTVSNVQRRTKCRIFTRMTKFFVLFCKKGLTAQRFCGILIKLEIGITIQYLGVAQLVARYPINISALIWFKSSHSDQAQNGEKPPQCLYLQALRRFFLCAVFVRFYPLLCL